MAAKKLVVFGLGARGDIYATFAKTHPEKFDLVAIVENDPKRLEYAKRHTQVRDYLKIIMIFSLKNRGEYRRGGYPRRRP